MGRKIVLLSDGTGNSAAKVWRTNVWRTFEGLDLSGRIRWRSTMTASALVVQAARRARRRVRLRAETQRYRYLQIRLPQLA